PTHKASPHAVDIGSGKPWIARAGQKASQRCPPLRIRGCRRYGLARQESRAYGNESARILLIGHVVLAIFAAIDCIRRSPAAHILMLDNFGSPEEGCQFMELNALPGCAAAGIMALSTLKLHAHEDAARCGRNLDWIPIEGGQEIDRRAFVF